MAKHCFLFLLLFLTALLTEAQYRPKIGLVLSGGGAKGLAHIGVLKAMEKAGIRPDYITGTSMGSIIGGLYAIGYSASEIEKMVKEVDWDELLANNMPMNKIVMEEKPYYGRYLVEVPTDNFKPKLPTGVIEGQALDELLFDLTRRVHNISDFNRFPIPFACMGTDITTGKLVVLNHGNLAKSIRASMAAPAVFTPVEVEGRLLVDGGLVHNFPVDEVIEMGADIVIGVYLGGELRDKKSLKSLTAILFQASFVPSLNDAALQKKKVQYLIEPDLSGLSAGNFASAKRILQQGEKKGEEFYSAFKRLADSLNSFGPQAPLTIPNQPSDYRIDSIVVVGNELLPKELISAKIKVHRQLEYTARQLRDKISILYGRGSFENIGYQLYGTDSTGYNMEIEVKETTPSNIKAAVHFDTENKAGVVVNYTLRNKLGSGSRLIIEGDLAEFPRLNVNYLKYLGNNQNIAVVGDIMYDVSNPVLKDENNKDGLYSLRQYSFRGSLITTFTANYNFGFDLGYNSLRIKPEVSTELGGVLDYVKAGEVTTRLYFRSDNLDRRYFPRSGSSSLVSLEYFFDSKGTIAVKTDSFSEVAKLNNPTVRRLLMMYKKVIPMSRYVSVASTVGLSLSNHKSDALFQTAGMVYFGGANIRPYNAATFYGATNYDYNASSFLLGKLDVQWQLIKKLYLTTGLNYINVRQPMEWLYKDFDMVSDLYDNATWRLGFGASLGYMTLVGPITFSASTDPRRGIFLTNFSLGFYL